MKTLLGLMALVALAGCHRATPPGSCDYPPTDAGFAACSDGPTAQGATAQDVPFADGGVIHQNVTYGTRGGLALQGDLYLPPRADGGTPGVVVLLHGGAWTQCARRRDALEVTQYAEETAEDTGAAVFDVEYRLAQEGGEYPANVGDLFCAEEWLVEHAKDFGVDGSRIALVGEGAGGQLALLGALETHRTDLDPHCGSAPPPKVSLVVTYSAPTDLPSLAKASAGASAGASAVAGPCDTPLPSCDVARSCNRCIDASPAAHACGTGVSQTQFLLVQAPNDYDATVPASQVNPMKEALSLTGAAFRVLVPTADDLAAVGCQANNPQLEAHGLENHCLDDLAEGVAEPAIRALVGPR